MGEGATRVEVVDYYLAIFARRESWQRWKGVENCYSNDDDVTKKDNRTGPWQEVRAARD